MNQMSPDSEVAQELQAVAARLAAMAYGPPNPELVAAELEEIRAELRRLAETNAHVRARLGDVLGVYPEESPAADVARASSTITST